ncbi:hypothetical protein [Rhodoferax sp.]|jgi:hypothetical protein|uniref:hypothetical protein n=1 Tax=Rhodoferax sp. TaxID=50421 RepID=UPI0037830398
MARIATVEYLDAAPARVPAYMPSNHLPVEGSKTLAGLLLAAALAAVLVVADQVISTWSDGHLLVGWVALWAVAFGVLAFLARPMRRLASLASLALAAQWQATQLRRQHREMLEFARQDPRLAAELQAAIQRSLVD